MPQIDGAGLAFVNIAGQRQDLNFVGLQIAGFNALQAVPEPGSRALLLCGLVAVGGWLRRGAAGPAGRPRRAAG